MNILIKLTCLIGLVIAPILGDVWGTGSHNEDLKVDIDETKELHLDEVEEMITEVKE